MFYLVKVLVERSSFSLNRPFTYYSEVFLQKGVRVKINFNHTLIVGFVIEDAIKIEEDFSTYQKSLKYKILPILEIIDEQPILNEELLELSDLISSYYFASKIDVLKAMLPPSLKPSINYENKPSKLEKNFVYLNKNANLENLSFYEKKIIDKLKETPLLLSEITSKVSLENLVKKECVYIKKERIFRNVEIEKEEAKIEKLNIEQQKAFDEIISNENKVFLLQGVTGSGKTEVYINLINYYLNKGLSSIVLVPEISLTDRLISKLKNIFDDKVALLHSLLTDSQKYDEYVKIASSNSIIVIGTRSAIFSPVKNLGLIVIDEEHVESYKQDTSPFYDARKVSLFRQKLTKCNVVYASATPLIETKAKAEKGIYKLLKLNHRYSTSLPEVEIVDLTNYENIDYESSLISLPLRKCLQEILNNNEQAILLLNRRGYSPIYVCRNCQTIFKCPNCSVPLTYHKNENMIICHHCDYQIKESELVCKKCGSKDFIYSGFGTQRVEEEINRFFPNAKTIRFDKDTTSKKGAYHKIISEFNKRNYDIMIGTQMVAKGHDFNNVTLACCLLADQSFEFPSYKANEDSFDLITQLVGRAGRNKKQGKAIIQTYSKDNYVLQLACQQDYEKFYNFEMKNRKERKYPPYTYLIDITISAKSKENVIEASYQLKSFLVSKTYNQNKRADIFGPAIPYIEKLNNRYYRKIMIKYKSRELIQKIIEEMLDLTYGTNDVKVSIDVDPSSDI